MLFWGLRKYFLKRGNGKQKTRAELLLRELFYQQITPTQVPPPATHLISFGPNINILVDPQITH